MSIPINKPRPLAARSICGQDSIDSIYLIFLGRGYSSKSLFMLTLVVTMYFFFFFVLTGTFLKEAIPQGPS